MHQFCKIHFDVKMKLFIIKKYEQWLYIHKQNNGPKSILKNQMWLKHGQQCHICHNQNALKICTIMESSNFVFGPL
jgi:hypothetical protein